MNWRCMRFGDKAMQGKKIKRSSDRNEEKCEKNLANMADIKKTLEITALFRRVYVRQLAEIRPPLAEL